MSRNEVSLQQVAESLKNEGLLTDAQIAGAEAVIDNMGGAQPWYIRTMVGFGAWLASLLLIGFVASVGFAGDGGFVVAGVVLMAGAIFARRKTDNDFMVQSAIACCLAGQAIFAYGIVQVTGSDEFVGLLGVVIILSAILFFVFPDRIHRVLSILIATTSLSFLVYQWELNAIVPIIGPAFAAAMVFIYDRQGAIVERGMGHLARPLITGLMLSAFGYLLLSTIYVLPELVDNYAFYPRPWISTILLGALLLYVGAPAWPQMAADGSSKNVFVYYGLLGAVVAAGWAVPGLLLALIVIILGASSGNRIFTGAGIVFLCLFIASYFYGIQITMLSKSVTLVATGCTVLVARWGMLKMMDATSGGGASHV